MFRFEKIWNQSGNHPPYRIAVSKRMHLLMRYIKMNLRFFFFDEKDRLSNGMRITQLVKAIRTLE